MVEEGRRFECRHCGVEAWICRRCDRGHCYCSPLCRKKARRQKSVEAQRRYQSSGAGRSGNARRQREWYRRKESREKVAGNLTHHGSPGAGRDAIIAPATADGGVAVMESTESVDTKAVETPASRSNVGSGDLPGGIHRCVICRCPLRESKPQEPQCHGTKKASSET
jgi:hypothetical protein